MLMATTEKVKNAALAELQAAWNNFREARRANRIAVRNTLSLRAEICDAYRGENSDKRCTEAMVTAHWQGHPEYIEAAELRDDTDDQLWGAIARLEKAWVECGLPGQQLTGWYEP